MIYFSCGNFSYIRIHQCNIKRSFVLCIEPFQYLFIDPNEANNSETDESRANESSAGPPKKVNFFLSAKKSVNTESSNAKYALSFHTETAKEMKAQKEAANEPIQFRSRNDLETGDEYFLGYDFPVRPPWTHGMSKETMNRNENRYFTVE